MPASNIEVENPGLSAGSEGGGRDTELSRTGTGREGPRLGGWDHQGQIWLLVKY